MTTASFMQPIVLRRTCPSYSILVFPRSNSCAKNFRESLQSVRTNCSEATCCASASSFSSSDLPSLSISTHTDHRQQNQKQDQYQQQLGTNETTFDHPAKPLPQPLPQQTSPGQQQSEDLRFMRLAMDQGHLAAVAGEVPVGAVLVHDGVVIASAHNLTHSTHSPLAHAEMLCIGRAAEHMQAWRLLQATLYVTIEPCPMCAGAILQSRLKRVVYGAPQPRMGCDGSWLSMFPSQDETHTHTSSPLSSHVVATEIDLTVSKPECNADSSAIGDGSSILGTVPRAVLSGLNQGSTDASMPSQSLAGTTFLESRSSAESRDTSRGDRAGQGSEHGHRTQRNVPVDVSNSRSGWVVSAGRVDKKQRNLLSAAVAEVRGPSLDTGAKRNRVSKRVGRELLDQGALLGVSPWKLMSRAAVGQDRPTGTAQGEQRLHPFHPDLKVSRGVLGDEAAALMKTFFRQRRAERLDSDDTE